MRGKLCEQRSHHASHKQRIREQIVSCILRVIVYLICFFLSLYLRFQESVGEINGRMPAFLMGTLRVWKLASSV